MSHVTNIRITLVGKNPTPGARDHIHSILVI
jgi:hypothetical protein